MVTREGPEGPLGTVLPVTSEKIAASLIELTEAAWIRQR